MNSTISHDYIVSEVLDVSQTVCHRDVTIICSNGTFKSNSFVLASAFPIFRYILDTPVQVYDPARILIPDLDYSDLETFFDDVNHHAPTINVRKDVKVLLGQFMVNSSKTMTPAQERTTLKQFRWWHNWQCSSPDAIDKSTEQERVSSLRPVHISPALLSPGGCRLSTVKI